MATTPLNALKLYFNRRMFALLGLGFASGLPLMLTGRTLRTWLVDAKVDVVGVGLFAGVTLPYSLKFLFAPLMDWFAPAILGRQRSWLLVTQVCLIGAIAAMGLAKPGGPGASDDTSIIMLALIATLVAFFSAAQDVVADGYRTAILETQETAAGAAVFVAAYRVAMIGSGAGAPYLAAVLSWQGVYFLMAGLMSLGLVATLLAPEPLATTPPRSIKDAVFEPVKDFAARLGWLGLASLLLFAVLFKLPETIAATWYTPLLQELKYPKQTIAIQLISMFVTIPGALLGGWLSARLGLIRSLWIFGVVGSLSNVGFYFVSTHEHNVSAMYGVILFESFCSGLVAAGFLGYLMAQCTPRHATTQFAILTGMMALSGSVLEMPTGWLVLHLGYQHFFLMSVFTGIPGLLLLAWRGSPRDRAPEQVADVQPSANASTVPAAPASVSTPERRTIAA